MAFRHPCTGLAVAAQQTETFQGIETEDVAQIVEAVHRSGVRAVIYAMGGTQVCGIMAYCLHLVERLGRCLKFVLGLIWLV